MKKIFFISIPLILLGGCTVNQTPPPLEDQAKKTAQTLTEKDRKKAEKDKRGHRAMPMTKSRLKSLLDEYNSNEDKQISWKEYNDWRQSRFNKTDTNNNNTLNAEEYVYEFENRLDERHEKGRIAHIKQTIQRFHALDKNNDNVITSAEYDVSGNRIFVRWDANKDGKINKDDPKPKYSKKKSTSTWSNKNPISYIKMPTTHSRKGLMKIYNANQDDTISRDEFNSERRSAFYLTDENKDGQLNSDEYLAEFEDRLDQTIETNRRAQIKQTYVRFGVLDSNKDKAMTFDELQISGKRIFTRWDKNKDGIISTDDIGK